MRSGALVTKPEGECYMHTPNLHMLPVEVLQWEEKVTGGSDQAIHGSGRIVGNFRRRDQLRWRRRWLESLQHLPSFAALLRAPDKGSRCVPWKARR